MQHQYTRRVLAHAIAALVATPGFALAQSGPIEEVIVQASPIRDSQQAALDGRTLGLPGTSDLIYNASVFYEMAGLSLRLNYQYRDEWISPIEDPSEIWGEMERVDATILYDLPFDIGGAVVSLYGNANNLTDETDVRFAGNGTINQSESFGRHYAVGVRVNY